MYRIWIIVLFLALLGCSFEEAPRKGIVLQKSYTKEETYLILVGQMLMPITEAEHWDVQVRGKVEGRTVTTWVQVDKVTYDQAEIGEELTVK
jgi:hypothetical protein